MTQERGIDAQERYERGNHLLNSRTTLPVEKNKTGSKRPWPMADEDGGYTIGNLYIHVHYHMEHHEPQREWR